MSDVPEQPISCVQWVSRDLLDANDYNPNHVATPELRLLEQSIVESGWTQPIVVRPVGDRYEIVDGYHRWTVSERKRVYAMTGGLVPVVVINPDPAHQRMATIRHNRARGKHAVVKMADIVSTLVEDLNITEQELGIRLGMDHEEVSRLLTRGSMLKRAAADDFGDSWRPTERVD